MSRGTYKLDQKVRNGNGNKIISDFIHKREFVVYSLLVIKPICQCRDCIMSVTLEVCP